MRVLASALGLLVMAMAAVTNAQPSDRADPTLTPGVANPAVTTAVACGTTWGHDARHVTRAMKQHVAAAYGVPWAQHAAYEFDHLISRELGGADDEQNLWPQPWSGTWNAHQKDRLENALHRQVCAGTLTLAEAQRLIRTDWIAAYQQMFPAR